MQTLLEQRAQLETACAEASATIKGFPKLPSGLTPDSTRNDPEYQTAKARYNAAFNALRNFNQRYARELRQARI